MPTANTGFPPGVRSAGVLACMRSVLVRDLKNALYV